MTPTTAPTEAPTAMPTMLVLPEAELLALGVDEEAAEVTGVEVPALVLVEDDGVDVLVVTTFKPLIGTPKMVTSPLCTVVLVRVQVSSSNSDT